MPATPTAARGTHPSTSGRGFTPARPPSCSQRPAHTVTPAPAAAAGRPPPPFAWTDDWAPPARPRPALALVDLRDCLVPYEAARAAQHALVAAVRASREDGPSPALPAGALLLLQHTPVYTLGAGATTAHLRFDPEDEAAWPAPLVRAERGGEVTYHGPGQLVLYPILDLSGAFLPDLHWYMRALEQVVIEALAASTGLAAGRLPGLTGVWCPPPELSDRPSKLAAVGVRAAGWVSYHGAALNVTCDLSPFASIVPCGIGDRPVGSVAGVLASAGGAGSGAAPVNARLLMGGAAEALLEAAGRVLAVDLLPPAAAGGRVGAAAAAVEAELRAAASAW